MAPGMVSSRAGCWERGVEREGGVGGGRRNQGCWALLGTLGTLVCWALSMCPLGVPGPHVAGAD